LSADGLTLVFGSNRGGAFDLWAATRPMASGAFTNVFALAPPSTAGVDGNPFLAGDGLWFTSDVDGVYRLYRAASSGAGGYFTAETVPEINSSMGDFAPALSADLRTLYFGSRRDGGKGTNDVWRAVRPAVGASFGGVENVAEVNSSAQDNPGWISPDDCRLYMESDRDDDAGVYHIYVAERDGG